MEYLTSLFTAASIELYVIAISALIALLAAIADITKTKKDDEYVGYIKKGWDKIKSFLPTRKVKW